VKCITLPGRPLYREAGTLRFASLLSHDSDESSGLSRVEMIAPGLGKLIPATEALTGAAVNKLEPTA
jgi:hypothetical protein